VLIVEDDESNSDYLEMLLDEKGLHLLFAFTGKEAMEQFHQHPEIDLILMDIRLPDTNGLELTRIIRKENPNLPIIAQTAFSFAEDKQECFQAGCNDFIAKPIGRNILLGMLNRHLAG
jgi:CheY-like chemotaxis protein